MEITIWLVGPGNWQPEMIFTDRKEAEKFAAEYMGQPIYEAKATVNLATSRLVWEDRGTYVWTDET